MDDKEKDRIMREIRDGVRLIAAAMAEPLRKRLSDEFLTSQQRKRMYREFTGTQSYDAIAKAAGVTAEAVRQFAVALDAAGLVVLEKCGAKTCPKGLV
jgi:hypothetical protein